MKKAHCFAKWYDLEKKRYWTVYVPNVTQLYCSADTFAIFS